MSTKSDCTLHLPGSAVFPLSALQSTENTCVQACTVRDPYGSTAGMITACPSAPPGRPTLWTLLQLQRAAAWGLVPCVQRQALKQHSPWIKSTLSLHRTLARTSFSRTFLGWEEVGIAYEIHTSKHSFQIYGNYCLFHLALVMSKENTPLENLGSNQRKFTGKVTKKK